MSTTVKTGDTHDVSWTVNMNLTGCTARLIVRPKPKSGLPDAPIVLASSITNAASGEITHRLTGTLLVGDYNVEVEVTGGGEIKTFPNDGFETLHVGPDLD